MDQQSTVDIEFDSSECLRTVVREAPRMGVTEFARSKAWRGDIAQHPVLEVLDRNETVAYVVSPQLMGQLLSLASNAEELADNLEAQRLFAERADRDDWRAGDDLAETAAKALDDLLDERLKASA